MQHRKGIRQRGRDRRVNPISDPAQASLPRLIAFGRIAIGISLAAWSAFMVQLIFGAASAGHWTSVRWIAENLIYLVIVTLMLWSVLSYLIGRGGYLHRVRERVITPRAVLEEFFDANHPTATVLIPSYREEPRVILQTMLSAALQEFADLKVVLLVDDPPNPDDDRNRELLAAAREVPGEIAKLLEHPRKRCDAAFALATAASKAAPEPNLGQLAQLAEDYAVASQWHQTLADRWARTDHTDDFFIEHILGAQATSLMKISTALLHAVGEGATMTWNRFLQLQGRLRNIFTAELTSFERKQFLALSHQPNKAMNLNSYLGLMGASYRTHDTPNGKLFYQGALDDCEADFVIPETDYLVTLDADSVLLPEYCLRIIYLMEQDEHASVGVAQTPYSSYPAAPTQVERLAGATTDIQYTMHIGMCHYDAAFWVGANAVLRTKAVLEMRRDDGPGQSIVRFLADRTPIEDTESTLDLTLRGWSIYNYPQRLAYSCSPPDFGALSVQRQRWSNGGLVILPKLMAHLRARRERGEKIRIGEVLLRTNYLASIAWTTLALLILLAYPFSNALLSGLVIVMSAPYFIVMSSDLHHLGYRRSDVFRVYGFNLIMLPVNASGVLQSLQQLITGSKTVFKRTPKIMERSVAPASFILLAYLIVVASSIALLLNLHSGRLVAASFAAINLVLAAPSVVSLMGVRNSLTDLTVALRRILFIQPRSAAPREAEVEDWASVLFNGKQERPKPAATGLFPEGIEEYLDERVAK